MINKRIGETPLQALEGFRTLHPKYKDVSLAYAGRLDPMAEGKLLVLIGEECKQQKKYTGLDKEYEIEVLLDIGSDTGDALGIVSYAGKETCIDLRVLEAVLRTERGTHMRAYPSYSSKTVNGKPLFLHALEGALPYMVVPEHEETIYAISLMDSSSVATRALRARVATHLAKTPTSNEPSKALGANFRIKEVQNSWEEAWKRVGERNFTILKLKVACASGTYMRSLASRLGEAFQTKALALSICRTRIGRRWGGIWVRNY